MGHLHLFHLFRCLSNLRTVIVGLENIQMPTTPLIEESPGSHWGVHSDHMLLPAILGHTAIDQQVAASRRKSN